MKYADCLRAYAEEIQRLADLAFRLMCKNTYDRLYLAGFKTDGVWTYFTVATDAEIDSSEELFRIRGEHLSTAFTVERLAATIRDWLKNEPNWIYAQCK